MGTLPVLVCHKLGTTNDRFKLSIQSNSMHQEFPECNSSSIEISYSFEQEHLHLMDSWDHNEVGDNNFIDKSLLLCALITDLFKQMVDFAFPGEETKTPISRAGATTWMIWILKGIYESGRYDLDSPSQIVGFSYNSNVQFNKIKKVEDILRIPLFESFKSYLCWHDLALASIWSTSSH